MLSCDVIIWDDNTPLFCFSWKLHSLSVFSHVRWLVGREGERGGGGGVKQFKCMRNWVNSPIWDLSFFISWPQIHVFYPQLVRETIEMWHKRIFTCRLFTHYEKIIRGPMQCFHDTLQRKSHLCIPRKGIARPPVTISTFMCLRAIYIFSRSFHIFSCSRIVRLIVGIYKSLTDTWML